jgi:hypothetical protein
MRWRRTPAQHDNTEPTRRQGLLDPPAQAVTYRQLELIEPDAPSPFFESGCERPSNGLLVLARVRDKKITLHH